MILIIGRFQIKAEERANFPSFAKEAIEHSKQSEGCLSFEILQDLAKEDCYVMLETWQDRVSLHRHFDTKAYEEADAKLNTLLVGEADWQEFEV